MSEKLDLIIKGYEIEHIDIEDRGFDKPITSIWLTPNSDTTILGRGRIGSYHYNYNINNNIRIYKRF